MLPIHNGFFKYIYTYKIPKNRNCVTGQIGTKSASQLIFNHTNNHPKYHQHSINHNNCVTVVHEIQY